MRNRFYTALRFLMREESIYLAIVVVLCATHLGTDMWLSKWFAWEFISCAFMGYFIFQRYGVVAGLCTAWTLWTALIVFGNQIRLTPQNAGQLLSVENITAKATIDWLLLIVPISMMASRHQRMFRDALGWLCLANSIAMLYQFYLGIHHDDRGGFLGNTSMGGSFIAVTYPFLAIQLRERSKFWLLMMAIPIGAIYVAQESVPVGAMAVVWFSQMVVRSKDDLKHGIKLGVLCASVIALLAYWFTPDVLGDSGRFGVWRLSIQWWWEHCNHWIGTGNGTFFMIGPIVQRTYHFGETVLFIWAHNDWLQTLLEQGLIGGILYIILYAQCVIRSWRLNAWEFSALMGYGAVSVFNFPAHNVLFALVGVILAARCLDNKREVTS